MRAASLSSQVKQNLVFMKRFCYRCGALESDASPLIQGLCQRCFAEEVSLLRAPREVEVVVCKRCGAYALGKQWHTPTSADPLEDAARETTLGKLRVARLTKSGAQLLRPREAHEVEINVEPDLKEGSIWVRARGKVHELQAQPKVEEATVKLNLTHKTCEVCSLKRARHHEAILQVRGGLTDERLSKLREALEGLASEAGKRERRDFIADIKELRGGLDFYVSSVGLARQMASLLKGEFGAELKESAKLVGQTRDGRKKYRFSILARLGEA